MDAEEVGKEVGEGSNGEGTEGGQEERVCVRDTPENRVETKGGEVASQFLRGGLILLASIFVFMFGYQQGKFTATTQFKKVIPNIEVRAGEYAIVYAGYRLTTAFGSNDLVETCKDLAEVDSRQVEFFDHEIIDSEIKPLRVACTNVVTTTPIDPEEFFEIPNARK